MCDVVARATVLWRAGFDHVDMGQDRQANVPLVRLPREIVDRLARPFSRFLRIETAGGAILLSFTIAALILSKSPWAQPFLSVWETRIGLQILFIANLAFSESLIDEAKLGIFAASVVSGAAGLVLLGTSPTRGISAARS